MGYTADYEIVRAARWRGFSWEQFDALDADSQARYVAEYRIEMRFLAVDQWYDEQRRNKTNAAAGRPISRRGRR